ncbi:PP2C family protein-serine/threonine phosphatase [Streptomyces pactum]|uniref:PP2C family protein-serine/threonine phosphatase n=1 Tax=Streptomyces pactum TaxID=68249 RepID=UPI0027DCE207|nr:PP2C family protein-serine/threonine phosphatase [Streptomyces pactum]
MVLDRLAGWVSDLTTLHELTERLARTTTLDSALHELLRAGAALVGARRGLVALEPADGLGPVTTIGLGLGRADLGHIETIPRGTASAGHLLDGLPAPHAPRPEVVHPDLASEEDLDPRHREVAARLGYAASYAVPLDPLGPSGTDAAPGTDAPGPIVPPAAPGPAEPVAPEPAGFHGGAPSPARPGTSGAECPGEAGRPASATTSGTGTGLGTPVPPGPSGAGVPGAGADVPGAGPGTPGAGGGVPGTGPGGPPRAAAAAPDTVGGVSRPGGATRTGDTAGPAGVTGVPGPAPAAGRGCATPGRLGGAVWLYDEPTQPVERQRHLLALYCRYAAEHLARLLELTRARAALATLRDGLLPARLPRTAGVRLAVRHRAARDGGGDWYDALPLPEGALGLAVGAVSGSGPSAVAAMGRLRASLRAYAVMEGEDPVAVLSDLELLLRLTEPARTATALFAYCEPELRRVVLAGAGHCPPLIIGEHRTEYVETSLSAPLGMLSCWEAPSVSIEPAPGETLLLYSDGLLHRAGDPMDRSFARLHAAAAGVPRALRHDPDAVVDHVLRTVLPDGGTAGDRTEDVVLLAAHFV